MELKDMNKAAGAQKLIRQWNTLYHATEAPSTIMIQIQGGPGGPSNFGVSDSEPEFADIWALVKAMCNRKYEEQAEILESLNVNSPDVNPTVKAAVKVKLGK